MEKIDLHNGYIQIRKDDYYDIIKRMEYLEKSLADAEKKLSKKNYYYFKKEKKINEELQNTLKKICDVCNVDLGDD